MKSGEVGGDDILWREQKIRRALSAVDEGAVGMPVRALTKGGCRNQRLLLLVPSSQLDRVEEFH